MTGTHTAVDLTRLFAPRAIALVGASPDEAKLSGRPLRYLERYGFKGGVFPVNPRHAVIGGHHSFARIADIDAPIDVALLLAAADQVAPALEEAGKCGIPFAIAIASGFAEAGDGARQADLSRICLETGIRLVGPNCVGILNPANGTTATFSTVLKTKLPRPGSIVLITQSGAIGNGLLQSFNHHDLGLRAWASTGNEADLGALDFLSHFLRDEECRVIAMFVEGFKQGERLVPLVKEARHLGKIVIALRAGRSDAGRAASRSHTGKLAGQARVYDGLARQAGLIEVDSVEALIDMLLAVETVGVDAARPPGLGILSISGGLGVVMSDVAAALDLTVPLFAENTRAALKTVLPPQNSVANPVDTALFASEKGTAHAPMRSSMTLAFPCCCWS